MARGVRSGATILSPNLQPQSVSSYDPITRRNTILVANIVPTLNIAEATKGVYYPSDRYYALIGATDQAANLAQFIANALGVTFQQWDATEKFWYTTLGAAGSLGQSGVSPVIHYRGAFGQAPSYAPKNVAVTTVTVQFTARFNANADYTVYGVGALKGAGTTFGTATDHFFQVLRNAGAWELGTCDGTTISQSSGGTGDGNWHEFKVVWVAASLKLYVDGVLTITKTTNMPTQALCARAFSVTNTIDIVDYLVSWE